jgi:hypothetical protein
MDSHLHRHSTPLKVKPEDLLDHQFTQLSVHAEKLTATRDAFKKWGVPEEYHYIQVRAPKHMQNDAHASHDRPLPSFTSLEKLLKDGPVIVGIESKERGNHAIVVGKIEQDATSSTEYVYIRDSIGGLDGKGVAYKVRSHIFQQSWTLGNVVVPAKSLERLDENEYSKG